MQIANTPLKYNLPFATNDSAKVEIPITTSDPTRFSLSLGSPPLTGQPPESGGVPPQLEDFNGAVNQISRVGWWGLANGPWPFDATFAADPNVNGYPQGSRTPTADLQGYWVSTIDNNPNNPDTVGTGWVPGYAYGSTQLTGQTGGTVTLTPAQAIKRLMTVSGTLTSNLVLVVPNWLWEWSVTNATTGAFTVTVKTAAGAGAVVPQTSSPYSLRGDGTNVFAPRPSGVLLNTQIFTATAVYTPTVGTNSVIVEGVGGGGSGGGAGATSGTQVAVGSGGGAGAYGMARFTSGFSGVTVTIGSGGAASTAGGAGNAGGTTSFGSLLVLPGGTAGQAGAAGTPPLASGNGGGGTGPTGANMVGYAGQPGSNGFAVSITFPTAGAGGSTNFGAGGWSPTGTGGRAATGYGAGSSGANAQNSTAAQASLAGAPGLIIVREYA